MKEKCLILTQHYKLTSNLVLINTCDFVTSKSQCSISAQFQGYQLVKINPGDLPDWPPQPSADYDLPFNRVDDGEGDFVST